MQNKENDIQSLRSAKHETIVRLTHELNENYKSADDFEENMDNLRVLIECFIWADQKKLSFVEVA